jgi:MoaA/NifB/PqqE/SkfB family radical SAM enzyme
MMQLPKFLFLDTNLQCNLKCKTCMYWTREEVVLPTHISIEQRNEIINEFYELNPHGAVVICGGEALMNPERYWPITRQCRSLGLRCLSVMNGTMVTDLSFAKRLITEGPTEITISLNSYIPEIHDSTRGVTGSFDSAVKAIKLLLEAREILNKTTPIYAMSVMCEQNYRDLDKFYDYVLNNLKADKLKLNWLQPMFGTLLDKDGNPRPDKFYDNNVIRDHEGLFKILNECSMKYDLHLDPEYIEVVRNYHRSVNKNSDALTGWDAAGTDHLICNSFDRNIMVDMDGIARLCFSNKFPGYRIRAKGDLKRFWFSADPVRNAMRKCTQYCGISHSVRRVNATKKFDIVRV